MLIGKRLVQAIGPHNKDPFAILEHPDVYFRQANAAQSVLSNSSANSDPRPFHALAPYGIASDLSPKAILFLGHNATRLSYPLELPGLTRPVVGGQLGDSPIVRNQYLSTVSNVRQEELVAIQKGRGESAVREQKLVLVDLVHGLKLNNCLRKPLFNYNLHLLLRELKLFLTLLELYNIADLLVDIFLPLGFHHFSALFA